MVTQECHKRVSLPLELLFRSHPPPRPHALEWEMESEDDDEDAEPKHDAFWIF